jgi:mannose-1-phosphate guanylyltransferase
MTKYVTVLTERFHDANNRGLRVKANLFGAVSDHSLDTSVSEPESHAAAAMQAIDWGESGTWELLGYGQTGPSSFAFMFKPVKIQPPANQVLPTP